MMKNIIELSKNICKYCVGMEGNISERIHNNNIIIKASGSKLDNITENDLVTLDLNGNQLSNLDKKPSMEFSFHSWLFKYNNKINYISHTHPIKTVYVLCSDNCVEFDYNRLFPDQVIFNGKKSCIVPYAKPGEHLTEMISIHVSRFIENENYFPKLILLKNHGIIACGSNINECIIISDICEKSAEIYINSKIMENVKFLSDNDVEDLTLDKKELYRMSLL